MKSKNKIIYIIGLAILIISAVFLPCVALADSLEDYGAVPNYENANGFQFELIDLTSYDLPMTNIYTKIPYSDNDPGYTYLYLQVTCNTLFDDYNIITAANLPKVDLLVYDSENDEDHQDALANVIVETYNYNGYYAFDFYFDNIAGYEELETDTSIVVTLSTKSLIPNAPDMDSYWDGYNDGYNDGYKDGYDIGKDLGDNVIDEPMRIFGGIFKWVGTLFQIELLPGISLGLLIAIPLVLCIALFVIHMIRG